ncbi:MAG: dNTP triphosphohydrolase [Armatimonadetes bacterium]|nr:dNTP triphosphohydrolase [Armatimonadota bacterium]
MPDLRWLRTRRHDGGREPAEVENEHQVRGDARKLEEKDRDKLLYSPYLRRLGGVSQVVPSGLEQRMHNRLTHSLEVSQLARRIAEGECEKNEVARDMHVHSQVAEAAGLAHDLGHPPFGHVGEGALDDLMRSYSNPRIDKRDELHFIGGFEGNAQTFRILTVLAVPNTDPPARGMNITRRTLLSVVKYPWKRDAGDPVGQKFGAYRQKWDEEAFEWAYDDHPVFRSPECEIMDYADDVVYSILDICDFYRQGLIDLEGMYDEAKFKEFIMKSLVTPHSPFEGAGSSDLDWDILESVRVRLLSHAPAAYDGSSSIEKSLGRWTTAVMDDLTLPENQELGSPRPFQLVEYHESKLQGKDVWRCSKITPVAEESLKVLKAMTWVYVINVAFDLAVMKRSAETILRRLVWYFDWSIQEFKLGYRQHKNILAPYIHLINELPDGREEQIRLAADIVASMTDQEAMHYYNVLQLESFA